MAQRGGKGAKQSRTTAAEAAAVITEELRNATVTDEAEEKPFMQVERLEVCLSISTYSTFTFIHFWDFRVSA